jgi:hypothetical protein
MVLLYTKYFRNATDMQIEKNTLLLYFSKHWLLLQQIIRLMTVLHLVFG